MLTDTDRTVRHLAKAGVAKQDWSLVLIAAHMLVDETGMPLGDAIDQTSKSLHGSSRLERDLMPLPTPEGHLVKNIDNGDTQGGSPHHTVGTSEACGCTCIETRAANNHTQYDGDKRC